MRAVKRYGDDVLPENPANRPDDDVDEGEGTMGYAI